MSTQNNSNGQPLSLGAGLRRTVLSLGDGSTPTAPTERKVIGPGDLIKMSKGDLQVLVDAGDREDADTATMRLAMAAAKVLASIVASEKPAKKAASPGRFAALPNGVDFQWYREAERPAAPAKKEGQSDTKFRPEHDALQLRRPGAKNTVTVRVSPSGCYHLDGVGGGFAGVTLPVDVLDMLFANKSLFDEFKQRNAVELAVQQQAAKQANAVKDAEKKSK